MKIARLPLLLLSFTACHDNDGNNKEGAAAIPLQAPLSKSPSENPVWGPSPSEGFKPIYKQPPLSILIFNSNKGSNSYGIYKLPAPDQEYQENFEKIDALNDSNYEGYVKSPQDGAIEVSARWSMDHNVLSEAIDIYVGKELVKTIQREESQPVESHKSEKTFLIHVKNIPVKKGERIYFKQHNKENKPINITNVSIYFKPSIISPGETGEQVSERSSSGSLSPQGDVKPDAPARRDSASTIYTPEPQQGVIPQEKKRSKNAANNDVTGSEGLGPALSEDSNIQKAGRSSFQAQGAPHKHHESRRGIPEELEFTSYETLPHTAKLVSNSQLKNFEKITLYRQPENTFLGFRDTRLKENLQQNTPAMSIGIPIGSGAKNISNDVTAYIELPTPDQEDQRNHLQKDGTIVAPENGRLEISGVYKTYSGYDEKIFIIINNEELDSFLLEKSPNEKRFSYISNKISIQKGQKISFRIYGKTPLPNKKNDYFCNIHRLTLTLVEN